MSEENGLEGSIAQRFPHLAPDDDLLKIVAWCEKLEGKIDTFGDSFNVWTRAILNQGDLATQQNRLIGELSSTLMQTGKTNKELGETLTQFGTGLNQLQIEFSLLKDTIKQRELVWKRASDSITNINSELSTHLKPRIEKLSEKLESIQSAIGQPPEKTTLVSLIRLGNKNLATSNAEYQAERQVTRILFGVVIGLLLLVIFQLFWVNNKVNSALLYLERIESR